MMPTRVVTGSHVKASTLKTLAASTIVKAEVCLTIFNDNLVVICLSPEKSSPIGSI